MPSAGSVWVDLSAKLDSQGRRELEVYERKLKEIQARTARRDLYKAELGASYDPRAFNAMERDLKRARSSNDDMIRGNARLRTSFGQLWSRGGAAFAAAGGAYAVVGAVKSITAAYSESQVSQEKMRAQLRALNISYKDHASEIDSVIQRTSKLAGLDDEDLQDAFTNIIRVTGDVNKSLKLTGLAADFARAKHMDVAKAGELVGKVAGGNIGILSRYGIKIKDGATASEALAQLQRRFSGQAEAYGKTQAGASDRVKVAWENLQETLGKKLGPTITKAMNGVANFINQMESGEGTGGKFVDVLQAIGKGFQFLAKAATTGWKVIAQFADVAAGAYSTIIDGLKAVMDAAGHLPGGLGRPFREAAKGLGVASDAIDDVRERMRLLRNPIDDVGDRLGDMDKKSRGHLSSIRKATREATKEIRTRLDVDTDAGQKALSKNFDQARLAIRDAMKKGTISTKTGLDEIRRLTSQEMKLYGVNLKLINANTKAYSGQGNLGGSGHMATGGWVGEQGMVGGDTVPAMLGVGEAVLNRHQQAIIEGLLGHGFLDQLFASVQRPHYLNKGGRVRRFATGGVVPAVSSAIDAVEKRFPGIVVTSTTGGGHAANSYHYKGMAADLASGDYGLMNRAAAWIGQAMGSRLLEGIHNPNLSIKNGARVPSSFWGGATWANHANHIHIALSGGKLGALGGAVARAIRAPRVKGGGALGDIIQGAFDVATAGANRRVRAAADAMGGGDLVSMGIKAYTGSLNRVFPAHTTANAAGHVQLSPGQVRGLASRAGLPGDMFERIAHGESNYYPGIISSDGGIGLWQMTPWAWGPEGRAYMNKVFGGSDQMRNPWKNALMAKYLYEHAGSKVPNTRGFPWYGTRYLAAGGRIARFASGGRAGQSFSSSSSKPASRRRIQFFRPDRDRWYARLAPRLGQQLASLQGQITDDEKRYSQVERFYNQSDEELLTPDGALDTAAIEKRAKELDTLALLRDAIVKKLQKAQALADRAAGAYKELISRLSRSLKYARGKNRDGVRQQLSDARDARASLLEQLHDIGFSITDAQLDAADVRNEAAEVRGTQATNQPGTGDNLGAGDAAGGVTADQQAVFDQQLAQANARIADLQQIIKVNTAFGSPGDIGTGNYVNAYQAASQPGMQFNGGLAQTTGGMLTGGTSGGGQTIVYQTNNMLHPADPQVLRAIGDAATTGQSLQPARPSSVTILGV